MHWKQLAQRQNNDYRKADFFGLFVTKATIMDKRLGTVVQIERFLTHAKLRSARY